MNRKEFLRSCACGFCACTAIGLPASAETPAAVAPKPEDWRFQFIKRRYAKLLENLGGRVGDQALSEILQEQGRYCASTVDMVQKHKGDIDGFIQTITREWKQEVTYDREKGVITMASPETKDCVCPLVDGRYTPGSACNCSLGWQQQVYETVLGKKVQVELKESVLRGGKRCTFVIHVYDVAVT